MRGVLKRVCNMLNVRSAQALTQKRIVRAPQKRAEKTLHGHANNNTNNNNNSNLAHARNA